MKRKKASAKKAAKNKKISGSKSLTPKGKKAPKGRKVAKVPKGKIGKTVSRLLDPADVTGAQMAELFKITRQAVSLWAKEGCPRKANARFDLSAVIAWRIAREADKIDRLLEGKSTPGIERLRMANASLAELKLKRELEQVVDVGEYDALWREAWGLVRKMMLRVARDCPGTCGRSMGERIDDGVAAIAKATPFTAAE